MRIAPTILTMTILAAGVGPALATPPPAATKSAVDAASDNMSPATERTTPSTDPSTSPARTPSGVSSEGTPTDKPMSSSTNK